MKCKNCNKEFSEQGASASQLKLGLGPGCYDNFIKNNPVLRGEIDLGDGEYVTPNILTLVPTDEIKEIPVNKMRHEISRYNLEKLKETQGGTQEYYRQCTLHILEEGLQRFKNDSYHSGLAESLITALLQTKKDVSLEKTEEGAQMDKDFFLDVNGQLLHINEKLFYPEALFFRYLKDNNLVDELVLEKMARDYALGIYDSTYDFADWSMILRRNHTEEFIKFVLASGAAEEFTYLNTTLPSSQEGGEKTYGFICNTEYGLTATANSLVLQDLYNGRLTDYNLVSTETMSRLLASRDFVLTSGSDRGISLGQEITKSLKDTGKMSSEDADLLNNYISKHGEGETRILRGPYASYGDLKSGAIVVPPEIIVPENNEYRAPKIMAGMINKGGGRIVKTINQSPDDLVPALKPLKLALVDENYAIHSGSLATAAFTPIINKLKAKEGVDAIVTTVVNGKVAKVQTVKSKGNLDRLADYNPLKAFAATKHAIVEWKLASNLESAYFKKSMLEASGIKSDVEYYVTLPNGKVKNVDGNGEVYRIRPVSKFEDENGNVVESDVYDITRTWVHNPKAIKAKSLGNTYFNLSGSHGQVDRGNVARTHQPVLSEQDFELIKGQKYSGSGSGWVSDVNRGDEDTLKFVHGTHQATVDVLKEVSLKKGSDEKYVNDIMQGFGESSKTVKTFVEALDFNRLRLNNFVRDYDKYNNQELLFPKRNNNKASRQSGSED